MLQKFKREKYDKSTCVMARFHTLFQSLALTPLVPEFPVTHL